MSDRIKTLKKSICGVKRQDNEWTTVLREQLHQDTVKDKLEGDIVPGCVTYKFFNRRRQELTQVAQNLSQSWHNVHSVDNKRGSETKKVLKGMHTTEEDRVLLVWEAYYRGELISRDSLHVFGNPS